MRPIRIFSPDLNDRSGQCGSNADNLSRHQAKLSPRPVSTNCNTTAFAWLRDPESGGGPQIQWSEPENPKVLDATRQCLPRVGAWRAMACHSVESHPLLAKLARQSWTCPATPPRPSRHYANSMAAKEQRESTLVLPKLGTYLLDSKPYPTAGEQAALGPERCKRMWLSAIMALRRLSVRRSQTRVASAV